MRITILVGKAFHSFSTAMEGAYLMHCVGNIVNTIFNKDP